METNTKELTTQGGHVAVIKTFLSYGELEPVLENEALTNIKKASEMVRLALVSLDGAAEGAFEKLRGLAMPEYLEVAKAVTEVINGGLKATK